MVSIYSPAGPDLSRLPRNAPKMPLRHPGDAFKEQARLG